MMREAERHPGDELQMLLDGRLDGDRRAAVEDHLAGCDGCRGELETLRWLKDRLARIPHELPSDLQGRIRAALDAEDAAVDRRTHRLWRWLPAAAAVLAAAVTLLLAVRRDDFPALAAAHLRSIEEGALHVQRVTGEPAVLEGWFASAGVGFDVHVFDLAGMDLRLIGGSVGRFAGGPSALFAYRSGDGVLVLCEMYRGSLADLPAGGHRRIREDGLVVRVFSRGEATLAFWQEGPVVCYLAASGLPSNQVTALAFAKAEPIR
ncbi:MAG TPA: anti-sigma factor [Thermoanaerobaculia bacterium]|jgi:anti-sigma factor RsiW|nr:anti-sigma factor [Thermoanaerobaculia bacterium]